MLIAHRESHSDETAEGGSAQGVRFVGEKKELPRPPGRLYIEFSIAIVHIRERRYKSSTTFSTRLTGGFGKRALFKLLFD